MSPWKSALRSRLLSDDPQRQLLVSQALLGLVVYAVFSVVQHTEVMLGMIDRSQSWALTSWTLSGGLAGYATTRWRLHRNILSSQTLSMVLVFWALVSVAWSYAITGPARGAVMLIMMLLILFGMFSFTSAQSRGLAASGFAMLGIVMVYKATSDPGHYDPRVEAMHFVFAGIVMAAVARLSVRIGLLRERMAKQRGDLKRALERIEALATRDELTGLINRRAVLERMHGELAVRRAHPGLSVAVIDLDHFKLINDAHGHATGDLVLRRFADQAQAAIRDGDLLARWGGEEFLLVLPNTSQANALALLARIRESVLAASAQQAPSVVTITFSAGVAECMDEADIEGAIARADAAMYDAKSQGRNRTLPAAPVKSESRAPVLA